MKPMPLAEYFKPCTHYKIEEVKDYGGVTIGGQCATCLEVIWGSGECDGCGKYGELRTVVSEKRYHGEECLKLARNRNKHRVYIKEIK